MLTQSEEMELQINQYYSAKCVFFPQTANLVDRD